jgi:hypothetical protein
MKFYLKSMLFVLLGVLVFSTFNVQAKWIIGRKQVVDGKPIGLCNIIPGTCSMNYADLGLPPIKITAIREGKFVLLDKEPKTDVTAEVDVKMGRGKMMINILNLKGTEKLFFDFQNDTALDDDSAKSLGFRSVIIKKGSYATCYSLQNPNGMTTLNVIAR